MAVAPTVPQVQAVSTSGQVPASEVVKKPRWTTTGALLLLLVAVVANVVIIAITVLSGESAAAPPVRLPASASPVAVAPAASASPPVLATSFGEGRFVVGTDIAAGTYRTAGKSGHLDCYWERLKDTSGGTGSIIANSLAPGPATVTIDKTDGAFQTRWCRTWTKIG